MKLLVIGNGGREHAIAWKLAHTQTVEHVYVAPGNGGTAMESKVSNVAIAATDISGLTAFVKTQAIDLTIVGPELPLSLGIVDQFRAQGLKCFGPTQYAAQLESSKAFSKQFMQEYGIPTARYAVFTEESAAKEYLQQQAFPLVIKADGLAAGKGVIIAENITQAFSAVEDMLSEKRFGEAGARVVIEEFLQGEGASFIVISDGETVLPLATSQDHKRRDDDDKGPNTGGMGAYSPAPVVTEAVSQKIMERIIHPTLKGMRERGAPYVGFLYAGVMIDTQGNPYVLEFNCRLGDPETQPLMMRLRSDLAELCLAALDGRLQHVKAQWHEQTAVGVVMASRGYPDSYSKGEMIHGLNQSSSDTKVFHAGTKQVNDEIQTDGGRVLCVAAMGHSVLEAQQRAYARAKTIHWGNEFYRLDIGNKAMKY